MFKKISKSAGRLAKTVAVPVVFPILGAVGIGGNFAKIGYNSSTMLKPLCAVGGFIIGASVGIVSGVIYSPELMIEMMENGIKVTLSENFNQYMQLCCKGLNFDALKAKLIELYSNDKDIAIRKFVELADESKFDDLKKLYALNIFVNRAFYRTLEEPMSEEQLEYKLNKYSHLNSNDFRRTVSDAFGDNFTSVFRNPETDRFIEFRSRVLHKLESDTYLPEGCTNSIKSTLRALDVSNDFSNANLKRFEERINNIKSKHIETLVPVNPDAAKLIKNFLG